jgi:hypothetical protein
MTDQAVPRITPETLAASRYELTLHAADHRPDGSFLLIEVADAEVFRSKYVILFIATDGRGVAFSYNDYQGALSDWMADRSAASATTREALLDTRGQAVSREHIDCQLPWFLLPPAANSAANDAPRP